MNTLITGSGSDNMAPVSGSKDVTTQSFMADVVEASRDMTVVIDFWAPWCGPCKQLTPVIEKVASEFKGRIALVKMNIDESPEVAGQLGVKSIPAVFAFKDGRPVDGFMGALPESQIRQFFEKVAGAAAPGIEDALAAAAEALAAGDTVAAANTYMAILNEDQRNTAAIGGLTKCYIEHGEFEKAAETLGLAPEDKANDPEILSARAALELAETSQNVSSDLDPLVAAVAANPNDHQARVDLAIAQNAAGQAEAALETLLESIKLNREANDAAARQQLLTFFEAWGPKDPLTSSGRRRLSSILFA